MRWMDPSRFHHGTPTQEQARGELWSWHSERRTRYDLCVRSSFVLGPWGSKKLLACGIATALGGAQDGMTPATESPSLKARVLEPWHTCTAGDRRSPRAGMTRVVARASSLSQTLRMAFRLPATDRIRALSRHTVSSLWLRATRTSRTSRHTRAEGARP